MLGDELHPVRTGAKSLVSKFNHTLRALAQLIPLLRKSPYQQLTSTTCRSSLHDLPGELYELHKAARVGRRKIRRGPNVLSLTLVRPTVAFSAPGVVNGYIVRSFKSLACLAQDKKRSGKGAGKQFLS